MSRWFLGLWSGPSHFGVDVALVRVDGTGARIAPGVTHFHHLPFGKELRDLLVRVTTQAAPEMRHLAALHRLLGETQALAVKQLLTQSKHPANDVICVGSSGVPLWHDGGGRYPATLDLGMAGIIAERTGLTVVSDFAGRDLALGGTGGPLSPLIDALLLHHAREHRVRLDLGALATVTSLPRRLGQNLHHVLGWQAAPCGCLLDGAMRLLSNGRDSFDAGGKSAVQGRCLEPLVERWMQHPWLREPSPKTMAPHEFGVEFVQRCVEQAKRLEAGPHDTLCTMTHFVARVITNTLRHLSEPPTRVLLTGRAVRNGFLRHLLEQGLPGIPLETTDVHGIDADKYKAMTMATMAALTLDGVPTNLPSVTGASASRLLGQWTPGAPANWTRCASAMARQATPLQHAA